MCENCWVVVPEGCLALCDGCGLVRYCGEVCKAKGWREHRIECAFIGQEGPGGRVLNDQLRLVARIWMRIRTEGGGISEEQGCLSSSWEDMQDQAMILMDKKEELLLSQYHLLGAVMSRGDMPDFKTFFSIYGKMLFNSFALRTDAR